MPRRSSKSKDLNQLAVSTLAEAVGEPAPILPDGRKNPAAVALGRPGGLKGAKPRAALSAKKRAAITRKAAAVRRGKG